jgi:hypothetical protein
MEERSRDRDEALKAELVEGRELEALRDIDIGSDSFALPFGSSRKYRHRRSRWEWHTETDNFLGSQRFWLARECAFEPELCERTFYFGEGIPPVCECE